MDQKHNESELVNSISNYQIVLFVLSLAATKVYWLKENKTHSLTQDSQGYDNQDSQGK